MGVPLLYTCHLIHTVTACRPIF